MDNWVGGNTSSECQKTATIFVTELLTGQVTLSDNGQPATGPYIYIYIMGGG